MDLDLAGKHALVTGANGGLGRHFALTLARAGARVSLAYRRINESNPALAGIKAEGGDAIAVELDVTDPSSVNAGLDDAETRLGPLDVVVNNAGIAVMKPMLEYTEEDWSRVIGVNLTGAWRVSQYAARRMVAARRGGSLINIASILGLRVTPQVPSYAAAKAGLIHLTQAMALELARHSIRVNALAPGYVETGMNRDYFASDTGQALIKRIPQRRIGLPEDLDGALLLLASDASKYMTGAVLTVDGGHLVSSL